MSVASMLGTPFARLRESWRRGDEETDLIVRSGDVGVLNHIRRREVGLALWRRSLPPALADWVEAESPLRLPQGRLLVHRTDADRAIAGLFAQAGTPDTDGARLLAEDMTSLTLCFSDLAASASIDVRLEVVQHDACWRFHRDCVRLRLLTTYSGPGTQFVEPNDAERALQLQKDYQGSLHEMPRHAVAVFKGDCTGQGHGIVHRSPPLTGRGLTRLVLCLNEPSAASPDLWAA